MKHQHFWIAQKPSAKYCKKCGTMIKWKLKCESVKPLSNGKRCRETKWNVAKCKC